MSRLYNTKNKNPIVIKSIAPTLGTKKTEEFKKKLKNKSRVKKMGGGMMGRRMAYKGGSKKGVAAKGAKPVTDPKVLEAIELKKPPRGKKRFSKMGGGMMGRRFGYKGGSKGLVGKQKNIDVAAPFGIINEKDFSELRERKK